MVSTEESSSRAWSRAPGGHGSSSRWGASSRRLQRDVDEKEKGRSTYTTCRTYHHGMARQCPRSHDGIKPGEVADDTSTKHPAHQAQISPRTRHNSSRASSRSPWPRSRASEAKGMQATRRQSIRSRRQAELPSLDLSIEHHLSSGDRRSSSESSTAAARRRSRQGNREREHDVSERGGRGDRSSGPSRWSGLTSRLAPTGGPGPIGGPGLAEREVRGRVFLNRI
jgi:hypothetical protein